ncbi:hypothetical protein ACH4TU_02300 [Streptomyces physcomitrii]|uniref:hypothetical protein n=1 Tax=Streptomyces physcomitrii TaxID=2724184 RepID=UPI0007C63B34|nr:hypothetical protein SLNHY_4739 [Streptomyces albus]
MTDQTTPRPDDAAEGSTARTPAQGVVPPGASEATRLLCAGAYIDPAYRDAVIDELYVHEERVVAPSLGWDAARVLAHALRARRLDLGWAGGILALWVLGAVLSRYLLLSFLLPSLLLALAAKLRAPGGSGGAAQRKLAALVLRWLGGLLLLLTLVSIVLAGFGQADGEVALAGAWILFSFFQSIPGVEGWLSDAAQDIGPFHAWTSLVVLLLVAGFLAGQRGHVAHALTHELDPRRFPDMAADPAESAAGGRFQRLRERIRVEQHAPLVMYHPARPFCGAGRPVDGWTLAVELRPDPDRPTPPEPLSNRKILRRIDALLAQLRLPAPAAATVVRDRLRGLETDECVFLPVAGLPRRDLAPYGESAFRRHRDEAVEEGGETRRHFLRARVGGWEEEIVTTVFVRVHTQGGMLMLEIAPHVLRPVRESFGEADRFAHQYRNNTALGKAAWALGRVPRSLPFAVVVLGRGAALSWRTLTGGHESALPDGPARSVRELGSDSEQSLFQEMDVRRYLKSVQDRIAHGVREVLREAGYRTDEFAQKIVNVSGGGVHIESVQGALAIGDHNTVSNQEQAAEAAAGARRSAEAAAEARLAAEAERRRAAEAEPRRGTPPGPQTPPAAPQPPPRRAESAGPTVPPQQGGPRPAPRAANPEPGGTDDDRS